jgi:hypothetical protein
MSSEMVRVNLADLPPLTEAEKAELKVLANRPDSEIDFSDIPPLTEEFWKNAVRGRFYQSAKTSEQEPEKQR